MSKVEAGPEPASPLPWKADTATRGDVVVWADGDEDGLVGNVGAVCSAVEEGPALMFDTDARDAAAIVHRVNNWSALLKERDELLRQVESQKATVQQYVITFGSLDLCHDETKG